MKKSFTLGAVSGITALAIGFPIAAQFAGAQGFGSSSTGSKGSLRWEKRAPLSQDDVEELIDRDNQILLHIDEFVSIQKEAIQNHRIALQAAADLTDEDARNEAVHAAHEAMQKEIEEAIEESDSLKDLDVRLFGKKGLRGPHGFDGKGPRGRMGPPQELLDALGMTAEELKAAIDSGKTIDQIAEEKGVELPARPPMRGMMPEPDDASDSQR